MRLWWRWCGLWRDRKRGAGLLGNQLQKDLAMTKAKSNASTAEANTCPVPTLLSVNAVAMELSVCTKTVRRLIERGALPICRVGRLVRIRSVDLVEFVASGTGV